MILPSLPGRSGRDQGQSVVRSFVFTPKRPPTSRLTVTRARHKYSHKTHTHSQRKWEILGKSFALTRSGGGKWKIPRIFGSQVFRIQLFFCVLFFDLNIGFSFSGGGNLRSQKESGRTVFGWWGGGEREASRKSWELFGQSLSTWVEMKSKQRDGKFSEGEI